MYGSRPLPALPNFILTAKSKVLWEVKIQSLTYFLILPSSLLFMLWFLPLWSKAPPSWPLLLPHIPPLHFVPPRSPLIILNHGSENLPCIQIFKDSGISSVLYSEHQAAIAPSCWLPTLSLASALYSEGAHVHSTFSPLLGLFPLPSVFLPALLSSWYNLRLNSGPISVKTSLTPLIFSYSEPKY